MKLEQSSYKSSYQFIFKYLTFSIDYEEINTDPLQLLIEQKEIIKKEKNIQFQKLLIFFYEQNFLGHQISLKIFVQIFQQFSDSLNELNFEQFISFMKEINRIRFQVPNCEDIFLDQISEWFKSASNEITLIEKKINELKQKSKKGNRLKKDDSEDIPQLQENDLLIYSVFQYEIQKTNIRYDEQIKNVFTLYQVENLISEEILKTKEEVFNEEECLIRLSSVYYFLKECYVIPIQFNQNQFLKLVKNLFPHLNIQKEAFANLQNQDPLVNKGFFQLQEDVNFTFCQFQLLLSYIGCFSLFSENFENPVENLKLNYKLKLGISEDQQNELNPNVNMFNRRLVKNLKFINHIKNVFYNEQIDEFTIPQEFYNECVSNLPQPQPTEVVYKRLELELEDVLTTPNQEKQTKKKIIRNNFVVGDKIPVKKKNAFKPVQPKKKEINIPKPFVEIDKSIYDFIKENESVKNIAFKKKLVKDSKQQTRVQFNLDEPQIFEYIQPPPQFPFQLTIILKSIIENFINGNCNGVLNMIESLNKKYENRLNNKQKMYLKYLESWLHLKKQDVDYALECCYQCLKIGLLLENQDKKFIYLLLGQILYQKGNYELARDTFIKLQKTIESDIKDDSFEGVFYNNLGCVYFKLEGFEKGLDYLHNCLKILQQDSRSHLEQILMVKNNLTIMMVGERTFKQLKPTTFTHFYDDKYKGILKGGIYKKPKRRRGRNQNRDIILSLIEEQSPSLPQNFPFELIPKNICEKEVLSLAKCSTIMENLTLCEDQILEYKQCRVQRDLKLFSLLQNWETLEYKKKSKQEQELYLRELQKKIEHKKNIQSSYSQVSQNKGVISQLKGDIKQLEWRIKYLERFPINQF